MCNRAAATAILCICETELSWEARGTHSCQDEKMIRDIIGSAVGDNCVPL
jgi:hypothetical protein